MDVRTNSPASGWAVRMPAKIRNAGTDCTRYTLQSSSLRDQLRKSRTGPHNRLGPFGAGRDAAHLDARLLLEKCEILLRFPGQSFIRRDPEGGGVPSGHAFIDRFDFFDGAHRRRHLL